MKHKGSGVGKVVWTKVGSDNEAGESDLSEESSGRFSVSGGALSIRRVEVADRGVYVCTLMSADGSGGMLARASAIVEVGRKRNSVKDSRIWLNNFRLFYHAF